MAHLPPVTESFSQNDNPLKVSEGFSQSNPNPSGFNSQTIIKPKLFSQRRNSLMGSFSHAFEHAKANSQNNNPVSIRTLPVMLYLLMY
jgi:hypothetical protein